LNKRFRRSICNLSIVLFLAIVSGVQASDDRMESVGNGLICMCGCNQLLSGCEMINCPSAPKMRAELKKHIDEAEDDKTIFSSFSAKYGPKVLSAPATTGWFNISAWVMPFVALAAGAIAVVLVLKHRSAVPAQSSSAPIADASKYEGEIEEELRKLNPED
jgi:cytochrome c-type biogenesis protein CcmH/NrfF